MEKVLVQFLTPIAVEIQEGWGQRGKRVCTSVCVCVSQFLYKICKIRFIDSLIYIYRHTHTPTRTHTHTPSVPMYLSEHHLACDLVTFACCISKQITPEWYVLFSGYTTHFPFFGEETLAKEAQGRSVPLYKRIFSTALHRRCAFIGMFTIAGSVALTAEMQAR